MELDPKSLLDQIDRLPTSEALRKALRIAQTAGVPDLSRWCRLELGGYWAPNPAMNEEVVVPEYRTVVGQHADIWGRVLLLEPDLAFVAETRLRNGIEELETLARSREVVTIHDPHMCELIRQYLQVEVYSFRFSAVHLAGILSAVRTEVSEKLVALDRAENGPATNTPSEAGEILELRPNFCGIGINLRALWQRWQGTQ